jgi:hypothetical protein
MGEIYAWNEPAVNSDIPCCIDYYDHPVSDYSIVPVTPEAPVAVKLVK